MKGRTVGIILLLVGSVLLGIVAGQIGSSMFRQTVPANAMSNLTMTAIKGAAVGYGLLVAGILFVWGLLVALVSPIFRPRKDKNG